MTLTCTLPAELHDAIIDRLHSDKQSLATCSLVCKAWLPRARRHLFAIMRITDSSPRRVIHLTESCSSIIPFIRLLELAGLWEKEKWKHADFVGLKLLTLDNVHWNALEPHARVVIFSSFATIVGVSLNYVYFGSFCDFAEFICAFPSLRSIRITGFNTGARWTTPSSLPPPTHLSLPCNLQNLDLSVFVIEDILNWIFSCDKIPTIHTYWLRLGTRRTESIDTKFLQAVGNSLKRIFIWSQDYSFNTPIDLSCNTQLRFIHFIVSHYPPIGLIAGTLSQVTSMRMEEMTLTFLGHTRNLELLDWSMLEVTLARPQFSGLKRIQIYAILEDIPQIDGPAWFEERLPGCRARGILSFADKPPSGRDIFLNSVIL